MNSEIPPLPEVEPIDAFARSRARLIGIAYRMLGSSAEAEDIVQDAWLRWHAADPATIQNAEAWLVTATTRLAIDRLRAVKMQRLHYEGLWLPEPVLTDSPELQSEFAEDVSIAFLTVLERLGPEARAAFLLREVFDADYGEVAATLGKSEAAVRQLVSRAKSQVRDEQRRHTVSGDRQMQLLQGFAEAIRKGSFAALQSLLAEDAVLIGDGGGKVPSFGKPLVGGRRLAQLYLATHLRFRDGLSVQVRMLNGRPGLLRFIDGKLESAQTFETDGERIVRVHVQRNPDKLAVLARLLGTGLADL
ncbi:RNA polymerase sigma-70 factor [soil metagenome]